MPLGGGRGRGLDGVVDLVGRRLLTWDGEGEQREEPLGGDAGWGDWAAEGAALRESVAELDDEFMEALLEGSESDAALRAALGRIAQSGAGVPVLAGAALQNQGIQPVLDAFFDWLPAPAIPETASKGRPPMEALAFKVVHDAQQGPIVYFRVYSGALRRGVALKAAPESGSGGAGMSGGRRRAMKAKREAAAASERPTKVLRIDAGLMHEVESTPAGHIGALVGLKNVRTGVTLIEGSDKRLGVVAGRELALPSPVFRASLEARSSADAEALAKALEQMLREDPSLELTDDPETGETLLGGMGELHLEVVRDRLRAEFGVRTLMGEPEVAMREAVSVSVERAVTFAPQHYAGAPIVVTARLSPRGVEGCGVVVAEGVPHADAVEEGAFEALRCGPLEGMPFEDTDVEVMRVEATDGPTPEALASATAFAVGELAGEAQPVMMQPVMLVSVDCPDSHVGPVLSDLTGVRRGRVQTVAAESDGRQKVVAEVPLAALLGYATELRSLTRGDASFSLAVHGYEAVVDES